MQVVQETAQSVRGNYKSVKGIILTVLEIMHQFIVYILYLVSRTTIYIYMYEQCDYCCPYNTSTAAVADAAAAIRRVVYQVPGMVQLLYEQLRKTGGVCASLMFGVLFLHSTIEQP